jgi:hypothetical protein
MVSFLLAACSRRRHTFPYLDMLFVSAATAAGEPQPCGFMWSARYRVVRTATDKRGRSARTGKRRESESWSGRSRGRGGERCNDALWLGPLGSFLETMHEAKQVFSQIQSGAPSESQVRPRAFNVWLPGRACCAKPTPCRLNFN